MKAQVQPSNKTSLKLGGVLPDGKVQKAKHHHSSPMKEEDNSVEIKEYLNKLQELVPFMPKNKKLSKLEVISYVIDYIQDLSETLGLPPSPSSLGSESSCDEDDEDMDLLDEEDRSEEISSRVTLSVINKKSSFVSNEEPVLSAVSTRHPLSVISNSDNKSVDGGQL